MKLFQIEEPDGSPPDADLPGAAIGIDLSGPEAVAAYSIGGNAVLLSERVEFARSLPVPASPDNAAGWQALFDGVRIRAERLLARPVTHAVVVLAAAPSEATAALHAAAIAGIAILRLVDARELPPGDGPALAAALLAEDLMPRSGTDNPAPAYFR